MGTITIKITDIPESRGLYQLAEDNLPDGATVTFADLEALVTTVRPTTQPDPYQVGARVKWTTPNAAHGEWLGTVMGRTKMKLLVRWDKSPEHPGTHVYPRHVDLVESND